MCFYSFSSVLTELTWIKCNKGMVADFQHHINFISAWLHEYERACARARARDQPCWGVHLTPSVSAALQTKTPAEPFEFISWRIMVHNEVFGSYQLECLFFQVVLIIFLLNNSFYELGVKMLVVQVAGLQRWLFGKIITTVRSASSFTGACPLPCVQQWYCKLKLKIGH